MALTLEQAVRLRIQDNLRLGEEFLQGDGLASAFKLRQGAPHSWITAGAAFVSGNGAWTATGGSYNNELGRVTFSGVVSANTAFRVEYQWAVFSTDEIGQFTAVGGNVNGAAIEAIKTLMFDNLKRARWAAPDGTSYDDTKSMNDLRAMYDLLKEEEREEPSGGIESWGEQQENYWGVYNA